MGTKPDGWGGILAGVEQLDLWLHVAMVVLTVASAVRYLSGHGLDGRGPIVLAGAVLVLATYAASPLLVRLGSPRLAYLWCATLVAAWIGLLVLAPSFAWVAVPLAFVALRVLPFNWARMVIVLMLVAVVITWSTMQNRIDPTVVAGPLVVATLAVIAYRSLERESAARRELLHELQDAQADLAEAQHAAGAVSERARISRDIHDSVAQGLSSINLLLQAAEQRWDETTTARDYIRQASRTARDSLDEVRHVVDDLASSRMGGGAGAGLPEALARTCEQIADESAVITEFLVHGDPTPVSTDAATALVRSARGALANVVEHSGATHATVSLTYQPDAVLLDVRDNGFGFDPTKAGSRNKRGNGLTGIEGRARLFGGHATIESTPGGGTALAMSIPLADHQ